MPRSFGGEYTADKDPTQGVLSQSTLNAAAQMAAAKDPLFFLSMQAQALQDFLDKLKDLLGIDIEWIVTKVQELLDGIVDIDIPAVVDSVLAYIQDTLGIDLTWLDTTFDKVWSFLTAVFGDLTTFLTDPTTAIQHLIDQISDLLGIDLSWIDTTFNKAWDFLTAVFGDLTLFVTDPTTAVTHFINQIKSLLGIDLSWISTTFGKVWTFLTSIFGDLLTLFNNPTQAITNFFDHVKTLLGIDLSWISTTFGKVWTFLTSIFGDLLTLFNNPTQAITNFFAHVKTLLGIDLSWISTAATKVVAAFESLFGELIDIVFDPANAATHFLNLLKTLAITIPETLINLVSLPIKDLATWMDKNVTQPIVTALTKNAFLPDLSALGTWASDLLTKTSQLPAANLVGTISAAIFGTIPVANIGGTEPNLLTAGSFDLSESVAGDGHWSWDSSQSYTSTGGSLKLTCNGAAHTIYSTQSIPTTAGDKLNLSAQVKTTSLAATGSPISISLIPFVGKVQQASAAISTAGVNTSWAKLTSATYAVPNTVTSVTVCIAVGATATSGTVNFDEITLSKTGLLQQSLVDRLLEAWNKMWQGAFGGGVVVGKTVDDILSAVASITSTANTGSSNASSALGQLTTLLYNLLHSPSTNIGSISSVVMDGVYTISTFLYYLVQGLGQSLSGTVTNVYTASSALNTKANTATSTANTAASTASTANSTANTASTTASGANTKAQGAIDNIGKAVTGSGTNLDVSTIITNFAKFLVGGAQPSVKNAAVPNLDASILTSGTVSSARLPSGLGAVGSGVICSKNANAYTTLWSGSGMKLPWGFYDNIPANTDDITIFNSSNITACRATNAGWYLVQLGYKLRGGNDGAKFGYSWNLTPVLYKGTQTVPFFYGNSGAWQCTNNIPGFLAGYGCDFVQSAFTVYLNANDVIYPGYFWSNDNPTVVTQDNIIQPFYTGGWQTAYGTYFTMSLLNRSMA